MKYTRIESSKVGDERRATRGMEDLDFHIGDEAMNVGNPYAVKVSTTKAHSQDLSVSLSVPCAAWSG